MVTYITATPEWAHQQHIKATKRVSKLRGASLKEDIGRANSYATRDEALTQAYIQATLHDKHASQIAIVVDVDRADAHAYVMKKINAGEVPAPSAMVINDTKGSLHAIWLLADPVKTMHQHPKAAEWAANIHAELTMRLDGDIAYNQVFMRNPFRAYPGTTALWLETPSLPSLRSLTTALTAGGKIVRKREVIKNMMGASAFSVKITDEGSKHESLKTALVSAGLQARRIQDDLMYVEMVLDGTADAVQASFSTPHDRAKTEALIRDMSAIVMSMDLRQDRSRSGENQARRARMKGAAARQTAAEICEKDPHVSNAAIAKTVGVQTSTVRGWRVKGLIPAQVTLDNARGVVLDLRAAGASLSDIVRATGASKATVCRWIKELDVAPAAEEITLGQVIELFPKASAAVASDDLVDTEDFWGEMEGVTPDEIEPPLWDSVMVEVHSTTLEMILSGDLVTDGVMDEAPKTLDEVEVDLPAAMAQDLEDLLTEIAAQEDTVAAVPVVGILMAA